MKINSNILNAGLLIGLDSMTQAASVYVGAFAYDSAGTADVTNAQSAVVGATRSSAGNGNNAGTFAAVAGSLGVFGGGTIGVSGYTGIDTASFGQGSNFRDMNRFGSVNGGLLTFDYDFSTYLAANPAGNGAGQFNYSVEGDYAARSATNALTGQWFISYNGGGNTLDNTLVTAIGIDGADELVANGNYTSLGTIPAATASGSFNFDVTSIVAASTDGVIRVAYFDNSFDGQIDLRNAGVFANEAVPEPSSAALLGLGGLALILRRKK